jgi:hypothetical protein
VCHPVREVVGVADLADNIAISDSGRKSLFAELLWGPSTPIYTNYDARNVSKFDTFSI